jgi:hypothetical protein
MRRRGEGHGFRVARIFPSRVGNASRARGIIHMSQPAPDITEFHVGGEGQAEVVPLE